jgi:hypothetical protein
MNDTRLPLVIHPSVAYSLYMGQFIWHTMPQHFTLTLFSRASLDQQSAGYKKSHLAEIKELTSLATASDIKEAAKSHQSYATEHHTAIEQLDVTAAVTKFLWGEHCPLFIFFLAARQHLDWHKETYAMLAIHRDHFFRDLMYFLNCSATAFMRSLPSSSTPPADINYSLFDLNTDLYRRIEQHQCPLMSAPLWLKPSTPFDPGPPHQGREIC